MINGRIVWNESNVIDLHNIANYVRSFEEDRYDNFSASKKHEAVSFGEEEHVRVFLQRVSRDQAYSLLAWWSWARRGNEFSFDFLPSTDIISNGKFDTDTIWTKGSGWTISGGVANASAITAALYQDVTISTGYPYMVVFTIPGYTSGNVRALMGDTGYGTTRNAIGTYAETIDHSGTSTFGFDDAGSAFTGTIDDVKVFLAPGNTTLDGAAASHQKTIPLTQTPFRVGDYCLIKDVSGNNYEIVQINSVSAGDYVTVNENLIHSYATGDIFRRLDYYPTLVLKPTRFELSLPGPGDYYDLDLEFISVTP